MVVKKKYTRKINKNELLNPSLTKKQKKRHQKKTNHNNISHKLEGGSTIPSLKESIDVLKKSAVAIRNAIYNRFPRGERKRLKQLLIYITKAAMAKLLCNDIMESIHKQLNKIHNITSNSDAPFNNIFKDINIIFNLSNLYYRSDFNTARTYLEQLGGGLLSSITSYLKSKKLPVEVKVINRINKAQENVNGKNSFNSNDNLECNIFTKIIDSKKLFCILYLYRIKEAKFNKYFNNLCSNMKLFKALLGNFTTLRATSDKFAGTSNDLLLTYDNFYEQFNIKLLNPEGIYKKIESPVNKEFEYAFQELLIGSGDNRQYLQSEAKKFATISKKTNNKQLTAASEAYNALLEIMKLHNKTVVEIVNSVKLYKEKFYYYESIGIPRSSYNITIGHYNNKNVIESALLSREWYNTIGDYIQASRLLTRFIQNIDGDGNENGNGNGNDMKKMYSADNMRKLNNGIDMIFGMFMTSYSSFVKKDLGALKIFSDKDIGERSIEDDSDDFSFKLLYTYKELYANTNISEIRNSSNSGNNRYQQKKTAKLRENKGEEESFDPFANNDNGNVQEGGYPNDENNYENFIGNEEEQEQGQEPEQGQEQRQLQEQGQGQEIVNSVQHMSDSSNDSVLYYFIQNMCSVFYNYINYSIVNEDINAYCLNDISRINRMEKTITIEKRAIVNVYDLQFFRKGEKLFVNYIFHIILKDILLMPSHLLFYITGKNELSNIFENKGNIEIQSLVNKVVGLVLERFSKIISEKMRKNNLIQSTIKTINNINNSYKDNDRNIKNLRANLLKSVNNNMLLLRFAYILLCHSVYNANGNNIFYTNLNAKKPD